MKHKFLLMWSWFVRTILFFLPDIPVIMRFRGFMYSLGMKKCGRNFQVAHNVIINSLEGLTVGNNVYFAMNSVFFTHYNVTLGDNIMFGPGCLLTCGNHTFFNESYRYGAAIYKDVTIGNGCWIGAHCVVLSGAYLPDRSVLAAGAILTHHLDDKKEDSVYGGIPAKYIKGRV